MGAISLEKLFPRQVLHSDQAEPISPLGMPRKAALTRCGFEISKRGGLFFEGETTAAVRLCEREWNYRQLPDSSKSHRARRWRLEFAVSVKSAGPIRAGHVAVIAQEPYENAWLQRASFKMYSKKSDGRSLLPVPDTKALAAENIEDAIEWLEQNVELDPWENNSRFVAGLSHPKGSFSSKPRSSGGDLVLGVCPDFDELVSQLLKMNETRKLIKETYSGQIVFWNRSKVKSPPRLHADVRNECEDLMYISVQQALAGPRHSPKKWIDQPVWKLVSLIYRDHLNARNRVADRRLGHEFAVESIELW